MNAHHVIIVTVYLCWGGGFVCLGYFIFLFNKMLWFCSEPLVHVQWDIDGGECDTGCVQFGTAVWRGGCWPWSHGQLFYLIRKDLKLNERHLLFMWDNCVISTFSLICDFVLPESTIWRSSSVWWSGWERTSAVSKDLGCWTQSSTCETWEFPLFLLLWAQVPHGPVRNICAVRRSGHRVGIRGGSELSTGGLPQGIRWLFTL